MRTFDKTILTKKGNELLVEGASGKQIEFTKLVVGCGSYDISEELIGATTLKEPKQEFCFSEIEKINESSVLLKAVISNKNLEVGYYITEIGIYGKLQGADNEVLYSINIVNINSADFLPPYNGLVPTEINLSCYITIKQDARPKVTVGDAMDILLKEIDAEIGSAKNIFKDETQAIRELIDLAYANANGYTDNEIAKLINGADSTLDTLGEIADAMEKNANVVNALDDAIGKRALQAELDTHINNGTIHMTATEKADITTPTFTQASERTNIESREILSALFGKIKKWFADMKTVAFTGSYNDLLNIPTSLKNPKSLIFTGAVTGSYDGSKEITVTFPDVEILNEAAGTPVGSIEAYMGTITPPNYLICDGAEYQIVDYPYLAQHFIDNFGSVNYFGGDGETAFAVPDLRGEFLRGAGTNAHVNQGSGSNVGTHQNATVQNGLWIYDANRLGINSVNATTGVKMYSNADAEIVNSPVYQRRYDNYNITTNNNSVPYMYSSRPTNTSVLYCIKYKPTYFAKIETSEFA